VEWCSALLNRTNSATVKWFKDQLNTLTKEYGVKGFKFDAGDNNFYNEIILFKPVPITEQTDL